MNVLIVEDEKIAAEKLKAMLEKMYTKITVIGHVKSIEEGVKVIPTLEKIDLAFFDIQLEDGLSFSILENMETNFPIIFTTAFDEYAIRAFNHFSIAYLLKPIQQDALKKAIEKLNAIQPQEDYKQLLNMAIQEARKPQYKTRFSVKIGDKIKLFETKDISCFFSRNKGTYIQTISGSQYLIDYSLEQVSDLVDAERYFRVNRKHVINIKNIEKVIQHSNSRLKIVLQPSFDEDIIVAREKVNEFKSWIEG